MPIYDVVAEERTLKGSYIGTCVPGRDIPRYVALFRQVRDPSGAWADAQVNPQTEIDLENAILTRARQVRLSDVPG